MVVGIVPDTPLELILTRTTAVPLQDTPYQLQYEMVGEPLEHSHPEPPAADTLKPLARLHMVEP